MTSIRRTLSPVPRPGTTLNGETRSVASPLSKSSSSTQNSQPPVGLLSSSFSSFDYALYSIQSFILGIFSKRSSRPIDRPKPKGQVWRRSLVHILLCFMVGVFFGLTPFASMNLSVNLMSKHQAFSFEVLPPLEKVQLVDVIPRNDNSVVSDNATLEPQVLKMELQNGSSDGALYTQSLNRDSNITLHKLLIIVTATYARPFQAYYLNHLAHTLKLIQPPLLWMVVDMGSASPKTIDVLRRSGVMYRHLVCNKNLTEIKERVAHQRNVALSHIETHRLDGSIYFADDSNIYSVDLFEKMRQIRRFGTWTVAKLTEGFGRPILEGPICNGTRVIGWHTNEATRRLRRFHTEMTGFAFNSTIFWDPKRWHRPTLEPIRHFNTVNRGFQASTFIEQVVEDESQMECLPYDRLRIMVWHLNVESSFSYPPPEWFWKNDNLYNITPIAKVFMRREFHSK